MVSLQSDLRSALQVAATFCYLNPTRLAASATGVSRFAARRPFVPLESSPSSLALRLRVRAISTSTNEAVVGNLVASKPSICTADELHYVNVSNSGWRLALWRYNPSAQATPRNHPLLLLSGVGTNAIGFDISPESSFARYMSRQGFDTWILELRGSGLSTQGVESKEIEKSAYALSKQIESAAEGATDSVFPAEQRSTINFGAVTKSEISPVEGKGTETVTLWGESKSLTKLTETFMHLSERLSGFLNEGFLEARQNSAIANRIRDLSQRLVNIMEEAQQSVSPPLFDLQERISTIIEDVQKPFDLIMKYDWDFDHYLEEDVPAAMEYIREQSKSKDGKLLAIGHSMGGILLYAMLSRYGSEGRDSGLAAAVTLASSLDYTSSKSALKLLLPFADPAQVFNVPVVPLGALLAATYPISSRAPYFSSWLHHFISSEEMMHPELFEKLVRNCFCTIPTKLLLQLTTAFRDGGLCDRNGTFIYNDHLRKSNVPLLALAGDRDLICPYEAVYETVKFIPENLVSYKVFGEPDGPHYAHYDLVGGRAAVHQVYPCIVEFLIRHDSVDSVIRE